MIFLLWKLFYVKQSSISITDPQSGVIISRIKLFTSGTLIGKTYRKQLFSQAPLLLETIYFRTFYFYLLWKHWITTLSHFEAINIITQPNHFAKLNTEFRTTWLQLPRKTIMAAYKSFEQVFLPVFGHWSRT